MDVSGGQPNLLPHLVGWYRGMMSVGKPLILGGRTLQGCPGLSPDLLALSKWCRTEGVAMSVLLLGNKGGA